MRWKGLLLGVVLVRADESCMLVADGNPNLDDRTPCGLVSDWNRANVLSASPETDVYGVRCCDDDGGGISVCLNSGTCDLVGFQEALDRCDAENMRLCTVEEVMSNQVAGTGCFLDRAYVWTSNKTSECPGPPTCVDVAQLQGLDHECPRTIVDLQQNDDGGGVPTDVAVSLAGIACCDGDRDAVAVCAGDNDCDVVDFATAGQICADLGRRLCTTEEIVQGQDPIQTLNCSTSSGERRRMPALAVWTSSEAECDEYTTCRTVVDGNPESDDTRNCAGYLPDDLGMPDTMRLSGVVGYAASLCCGPGANITAMCNYGCEQVSFHEASERCVDAGLRLCTETELLANTEDLDCEYNELYAWTSDVGVCRSAMTFGGALEIPPWTWGPTLAPTPVPTRTKAPSHGPTSAPSPVPTRPPTYSPTPIATYPPSFVPTPEHTRNLTDADGKAFFGAPVSEKFQTTTAYVAIGVVVGLIVVACCCVNTLAVRHVSGDKGGTWSSSSERRPQSQQSQPPQRPAASTCTSQDLTSSHLDRGDSVDVDDELRDSMSSTSSSGLPELTIGEEKNPEVRTSAEFDRTVSRLYSEASTILESGSFYIESPSPTSPLSGIPSEGSTFGAEEKDDAAKQDNKVQMPISRRRPQWS